MKAKAEVLACPHCGNEKLKTVSAEQKIKERDGGRVVVPDYEYTSCPQCEIEFVTGAQAKANSIRISNAKRAQENLLTAGHILAIRKRFKLTQEDASKLFGGGRNAFSKYELGYVNQSAAMDKLLRVAQQFPEVVPYLAHLSGIDAPHIAPIRRSYDATKVTKKVGVGSTTHPPETETYIGNATKIRQTRIVSLEKVRKRQRHKAQPAAWTESFSSNYG